MPTAEKTRAKIVHVDLEEELRPIAIEDRYQRWVLIVHLGGSVIGQVVLQRPPLGVVTVGEQWTVISHRFDHLIWRSRFRAAVEARIYGAGRDEKRSVDQPAVSVIVCTRDRPDQLRRCLNALLELRTQPLEILVIDNCPSDDRTQTVCGSFPVRHIVEPLPGQTRARNRGIVESRGAVIAFTDDDCVPHPDWLDNLSRSFADPVVMAVTGYIGPFELEEPAQYLFETHYGFGRTCERRVLDHMDATPLLRAATTAGAGANMMIRREAFRRIGMFPEDLGPGTPARSGDDKYYFFRILAAGYRIVQEPSRKVWHRHRADLPALKKIMNDYGVAEFALTTRWLLADREPGALRMVRWWASHFVQDFRRLLRRDDEQVPLSLVLAELRGAFTGPWAMLRSRLSRRGIPSIQLPADPAWDEATAPVPPVVVVGAELPELSIALPTYNRRDDLRCVLEALARQRYPPERVEVVVVVDGSQDGTADMARSLAVPYRLRVLEQDNRGTAVARNRAVREARGAIIVFLDDDIRPEPAFLATHAHAHADGRNRFALGYCPPAVSANTFLASLLRNWWEDHYRVKAQYKHLWTFIDCSEGNASVRRELLLSLGGLDENFPRNRADWELGVRLLEAGVELSFHPAAKAWHHYVPSLEATLRKTREAGKMDVRLAAKHPQVIGQLPLAHVAWLLASNGRSLRPRCQMLGRLLVETRALYPLLDLFEALNLRRPWYKTVDRMFSLAYVLGVLDALPDEVALRAFLQPIAERTDVTTLALAFEEEGDVMVRGAVGRVELEVGRGGCVWGTTPALNVGSNWDWDLVFQRIVDDLGHAARLDATLAGLAVPGARRAGSGKSPEELVGITPFGRASARA